MEETYQLRARQLTGSPPVLQPVEPPLSTFNTGALTLFALMTAFANGCTAMTGVEAISTDVRALYVNDNPQAVATLLDYIKVTERERTNAYITIVLPEFVPSKWWHHLLHNQRTLLIKGALLFRKNVIVTSVPFHLE